MSDAPEPTRFDEPGAERALQICLHLFEALGDSAGADACRRALLVVDLCAGWPARGRLTPREHHVARLVAAGATNRQIAQALHISPGTSGRHIANIFLKLGFHARAQLASWYASNDDPDLRPTTQPRVAKCYKTQAGPR